MILERDFLFYYPQNAEHLTTKSQFVEKKMHSYVFKIFTVLWKITWNDYSLAFFGKCGFSLYFYISIGFELEGTDAKIDLSRKDR